MIEAEVNNDSCIPSERLANQASEGDHRFMLVDAGVDISMQKDAILN